MASATRGRPAKPFWPVQLGTAVNMKPATALMMKPNSISWLCQSIGGHVLSVGRPVTKLAAQNGISVMAANPANRNWDLNP